MCYATKKILILFIFYKITGYETKTNIDLSDTHSAKQILNYELSEYVSGKTPEHPTEESIIDRRNPNLDVYEQFYFLRKKDNINRRRLGLGQHQSNDRMHTFFKYNSIGDQLRTTIFTTGSTTKKNKGKREFAPANANQNTLYDVDLSQQQEDDIAEDKYNLVRFYAKPKYNPELKTQYTQTTFEPHLYESTKKIDESLGVMKFYPIPKYINISSTNTATNSANRSKNVHHNVPSLPTQANQMEQYFWETYIPEKHKVLTEINGKKTSQKSPERFIKVLLPFRNMNRIQIFPTTVITSPITFESTTIRDTNEVIKQFKLLIPPVSHNITNSLPKYVGALLKTLSKERKLLLAQKILEKLLLKYTRISFRDANVRNKHVIDFKRRILSVIKKLEAARIKKDINTDNSEYENDNSEENSQGVIRRYEISTIDAPCDCGNEASSIPPTIEQINETNTFAKIKDNIIKHFGEESWVNFLEVLFHVTQEKANIPSLLTNILPNLTNCSNLNNTNYIKCIFPKTVSTTMSIDRNKTIFIVDSQSHSQDSTPIVSTENIDKNRTRNISKVKIRSHFFENFTSTMIPLQHIDWTESIFHLNKKKLQSLSKASKKKTAQREFFADSIVRMLNMLKIYRKEDLFQNLNLTEDNDTSLNTTGLNTTEEAAPHKLNQRKLDSDLFYRNILSSFSEHIKEGKSKKFEKKEIRTNLSEPLIKKKSSSKNEPHNISDLVRGLWNHFKMSFPKNQL